jgi:Small-conductance mechanosensitive channel
MPAAEGIVKAVAAIDRPRGGSDHPRMPRLARILLLLLLAFGSTVAFARQDAAPAAPPPTPAAQLEQMRSELDGIKKALATQPTAAQLGDLRTQALAVQDQASQLAASLAPQVQSVQAQLAVLGPRPQGAPAEAAEVSAQRRKLDKAQADVDAQVKQAQLIGQEAAQLAAQLSDQRRNEFQTRLAERTATPFSTAFWSDPMRSLPSDLRRLRALGSDLSTAIRAAWQPANRTPFVTCLLAAALLLGVGRWLLERQLLRLTQNRMAAGRLRRSALALAIAVLTTLNTGLAAQLVYWSVNWNGLLDDDLAALAHRWCSWCCSVPTSPGSAAPCSRRCARAGACPSLADAEAQALRPFPWLLAMAIALLGTVELVTTRSARACRPA